MTSFFPLNSAEDKGWIVAAIDRLELNGRPAAYQRKGLKKNGEEAWINVVMGRIVNSNGQEVIQAVFTDITEQRRLEKAQEQERILENSFLRAAIYTAYPLIMSINLTNDNYHCLVNNQKLFCFKKRAAFQT